MTSLEALSVQDPSEEVIKSRGLESQKFLHTPFHQEDSIRIIALQPGSRGSDISIFLENTPLAQAPPFEALSYAWGSAIFSHRITCNGRDMYVTPTLLQALQALRSEKEIRLLWIDQISIDQKNIPERQSQVQMMGSIYQRATKTVVFMGDDVNEQAPIALYVLNKLAEHFSLEYSIQDYPTLHNMIRRTHPKTLMERSFPRIESSEWLALLELFSQAWFCRRWVLQEICLAEKVEAYWGSTLLNWNRIGMAAAWLGRMKMGDFVDTFDIELQKKHEKLGSTALANANVMQTVHADVWKKGSTTCSKLPLLELLHLASDFQVTDLRDRLYAVLGLSEEATSARDALPSLSPDYSRSIETTFLQLTKELIRYQQSLQVLSHVHREDSPPLFPRRPTWVPDWTKADKAIISYPHTRTGKRTVWASGELRATVIPTVDNSLLSLQGFRLASIETTTQRLTLSGIQNGDLSHIPEQLLKRPVWDLADTTYQFQVGSQSFRSRLSLQDAFVFTLNAGRLWREEKYLKADTAHVVRSLSKAASIDAPQARLNELTLEASDGDGNFYWATALQTCVERKFFVAAGGILGLGPHTLREDDVVCFLFGGDVPFILRPTDNGCHFLIGECFLQSLMHGQAIQMQEQCHLGSEVFTLC